MKSGEKKFKQLKKCHDQQEVNLSLEIFGVKKNKTFYPFVDIPNIGKLSYLQQNIEKSRIGSKRAIVKFVKILHKS